METECKWKYAIVGRYRVIGDIHWIKYNKYKTLESAEQAMRDMKYIGDESTHEGKIVPYFEGYHWFENMNNEQIIDK